MRPVLLLACLSSGRNINATAMTLDFLLSSVTPLNFPVLGDILALRVGLFMFSCPSSCWVVGS